MSRSQFILGIALLVVSATLAFTITFKSESAPDPATVASRESQSSTPTRTRQVRSIPSSESSPRKDRTFYEVTVNDRSLTEVAAIVQEESLQELDALTERYNLTTSQRRGIFPHIAARHPQFQEGLIINGSATPSIAANSSLEDAMYPLLNEDQREDLENDILTDSQWWSEVISQLRDDLDQAISDGDIVPTVETVPSTKKTAPGDGAEIDNPDVDLNNLFK